MQELKKILEEIEKGTHTFELLGRDVDFVAIDWVRDVIRKYMNDDNEIMEQCPYCENEAALHWDVEKDGHQVFCPNCGKPMMLCSMCDARDGAVCDWKEGEGCKHSDERYRDYFRKHMNDGWNSVEKYGLPKDEGVYDLTIINGLEEYVSVRWQFLSGTHLSGTQHYVDGVHYWADNYRGDPINEFLSERVIAWRKKPEPYRPERSEE